MNGWCNDMRSAKAKSVPNRRQSCCTKCGRPSRGHIGPQGTKCGMAPMSPVLMRLLKMAQPDFDNVSETSGKDAVLVELSNQMVKMSLSMQQLQSDVKVLKKEKAEPSIVLALKSPDITMDAGASSTKAGSDTYECLLSWGPK
jgi:hypothetical protein